MVHVDDWRKVFYAFKPDRSEGSSKKAFQRARKELCQKGLVGEQADYYWREPTERVLKKAKL